MKQKGGFLGMLLGTLGATLLENMLTGKGIVRTGCGNRQEKVIVRVGFGLDFLTICLQVKP